MCFRVTTSADSRDSRVVVLIRLSRTVALQAFNDVLLGAILRMKSKSMRQSRRLWMLCAPMLLTAVPTARARAQSCPLADSTMGSNVDKKAFYGRKYDPMTDSTVMAGKGMIDVPMLGLPTNVFLNTSWQGKAPASSASTRLSFSVSQVGKGRELLGVAKEDARYADADAALLLLDDTVRLRLPRASYTAHLSSGALGLAKWLIEDITFEVPWDNLKRLGQARAGTLRIGPTRLKVSKELISSARETLRFYLCNPDVAKP